MHASNLLSEQDCLMSLKYVCPGNMHSAWFLTLSKLEFKKCKRATSRPRKVISVTSCIARCKSLMVKAMSLEKSVGASCDQKTGRRDDMT